MTQQTTSRPRVVIIGGGPCGLYAARSLVEKDVDVVLLEKEAKPGGLATAHRHGGNFYDMGVHMLHEFDKEIFHDIVGIMGDERIAVSLDAKIRWAGSFYRYPLQFVDMIKGIPPFKLLWCVMGLFGAQLYFKFFPREPRDAEEALIQLYGRPLYEFFFKDFTERYWGFPTTEISAKFITTKMPRLTAVDVIKKVLAKIGIKSDKVEAVDSALLEETLHYSRTGAEAMTRLIAERIRQKGGDVRLHREVTGVQTTDNRVTAVLAKHAETGETETHACDYCISTMPLPWLMPRLEGAPAEVIEASKNLRYKAITIHGLLVNKPRCLDALYIYYRERLFHRIGDPKNAGLTVNPPDHSVLIVETTCEEGDPKWQAAPEIRERIIADLAAENICTREQIVEWHVMHSTTGYPVFKLGFEPHFDRVKQHLATLPNLRSVGRQGGFCYPNMHGAMRMGANAAKSILELIETNAPGGGPAKTN
ncbi:MAG: FAD-dependent oxidoreductase [Verrucomicrobiales bacterium]|nr:FAD-dependent oxidoreductase [Verrucomicrobiales bacterium]